MNIGMHLPGDLKYDPRMPLPAFPRVLALEWNLPFHVDVAARLAERHNWQFVYWVGDEAALGIKVRERFSEIIFHDTVDARYARPPAVLADLKMRPFDESMAESLAYEQPLVLKMMDRIELLGSFSYQDRVRLFHNLVAWWSALLDRIKPDIMMIPSAPHVIYDYVAYALCRRRGVRTAMFENGTVRGILLPCPVFEDGFPDVIAAYSRMLATPRPGDDDLSRHFQDYLDMARGSYVLPHDMAFYTEMFAPAQTLSMRTLAGALMRKATKVINVSRYPAYFLLLKQEFRRALARTSTPERPVSGHLRGAFIKAGEAHASAALEVQHWVDKQRLALKREYQRRVSSVDLMKPYVYVPLHVQPERSTSPNGGIYDHADLLIQAVAQSVPSGWLVYVKEHPSQFKPWHVGERGRRLSDYAAMTAAPNVRLVPEDTKPFDLIDNARAVATVTGTSGWEALARGVPVLCFGIAWYQGCHGVYDTRGLKDLEAALEDIARGARPDPHKVRLFLKAVETVGVRGYFDIDTKGAAQISEQENIIALSDSLASMIYGTRVHA
jgi:hypothetical protein